MVWNLPDIHDQKTASEILEQRVKERTRELEIRNKELEQFTFVSHHDLQEPLRKIMTFCDLIKSDSYHCLTCNAQKWLDKISDTALKMRMVVKDILNFAILNKEEILVQVNLGEVMSTVIQDLEQVIIEKNAQIHFEKLPVINAVAGQMQYLFYNLLNNSLKFSTPDAPPLINVTSRTLSPSEIREQPKLECNGQYIEIAVQDNGIGFDQKEANQIFDMLQRLHNKKDYEGTGATFKVILPVR